MAFQREPHIPGPGMLLHIAKSFLDDSEKVQFHIAWRALREALNTESQVDAGACFELAAEVSARNRQAKGIQVAGPQPMCDASILFQGGNHLVMAPGQYFTCGRPFPGQTA